MPVTNYPLSKLELSYSTLNGFKSCPRTLEFAKLYGFNLHDRSRAADGGSAIHAATGVYIVTKDKNAAILELLLKYPIDLGVHPFWSWSLEAAYGALIVIFQFFDTHTELEIAMIDGKPAIEVPFIIEIDHGLKDFIPVVYRGYIDFIFYNRLDDTYFVLELKNTASNIKDFTPVYIWDTQGLPYALVLNKLLNKEIDNLEIRYLIAKVDVASPVITEVIFEKSEAQIEEWARELYLQILSIKNYTDMQWFPRNAQACMKYNRHCKFFSLCPSRKLNTVKLMLDSMKKSEPRKFDPWITIDLKLINQ